MNCTCGYTAQSCVFTDRVIARSVCVGVDQGPWGLYSRTTAVRLYWQNSGVSSLFSPYIQFYFLYLLYLFSHALYIICCTDGGAWDLIFHC